MTRRDVIELLMILLIIVLGIIWFLVAGRI